MKWVSGLELNFWNNRKDLSHTLYKQFSHSLVAIENRLFAITL